jgi:hypothetical protein
MSEPFRLDDYLAMSEQFSTTIWEHLDGQELPVVNPRSLLVASFLTLALEHYSAVVVLTRAGWSASAFAMIRPIYEAYIRGRWLQYCASELELSSVSDREKFPRIKVMVDAIEVAAPEEKSSLRRLTGHHQAAWDSMNSYTHGGQKQILNRITWRKVQSNFSDEQVIAALKIASAYGLLISTAVSLLLGRDEYAVAIHAKFNALFGKPGDAKTYRAPKHGR